ncbi:ABC transporter permease [Oxalobacter sp. OttesenSCG-928-P03]|nr:ABC transporter permease [Oxalobacter sp. OttesenSCG-928-P03]
MHRAEVPKLQVVEKNRVIASGCWRVDSLAFKPVFSKIGSSAKLVAGRSDVAWDLTGITALDYIGAQFFWNAWGHDLPSNLKMLPEHKGFFDRLKKTGQLDIRQSRSHAQAGALTRRLWRVLHSHFIDIVTLTGQFILDCYQFFRNPLIGPWKEISANVYHSGTRAIGITALVGFLIGVVLSYLSAQQLHNFGGDPYLVDLLGIGITRELGPLLAAILVAGRSGSSMTAQIGVMRVTEELDAMQVMGMSHGFRLVLPKVIALSIVMPLLVMWTNIVALVGGMMAAQISIGLSIDYFISALPGSVPPANLIIGLVKGMVFGALIALISCHFGLRIQPNTESLGQGTTSAVVSAITIVILADAVFAIVLQHVGWK